jgi:hypothetical protein
MIEKGRVIMEKQVIRVTSKAPVKGMLICILTGWIFFFLPIPILCTFIGILFNIAGFILAIICLSRDKALMGVLGILSAVIGSIIVYLLSWGVYALFTFKTIGDAARKIHKSQQTAVIQKNVRSF